MAKDKNINVGTKFTGDARGFKSAAGDAQKASKALADKSKKDSKGLKTNFDSLGGSIGGVGGKMGAFFAAISAGFKTLGKVMKLVRLVL